MPDNTICSFLGNLCNLCEALQQSSDDLYCPTTRIGSVIYARHMKIFLFVNLCDNNKYFWYIVDV